MFRNFLNYLVLTNKPMPRDISLLFASTLADASDIVNDDEIIDSEKIRLLDRLLVSTKVILTTQK